MKRDQGRERSVRDPIHGDIQLTPLEAAVVDTRQFQRLRYIRQNGLLHFVFPGAVHTRFAHSLGALALAKRAFEQLVAPVVGRDSLDHIRTAFRLAALLHDVGHCAFSHSIENVEIDGKPFFGMLPAFLVQMKEDALLAELRTILGDRIDATATKHEHISLVLVRRIFAQEGVRKLSRDPDALCQDVVALIDGRLKPSATFKVAAEELREGLSEAGAARLESSDGILSVFHDLVSGTLDVDRLDYLVRDSIHCGVPYGRCEVEFLLKSIHIGCVAGRAALVLDEKARYALEDMLWSRYQLFVQVLNHKTNVALNAALKGAMESAIEEVRIERPDTEGKLIAFTDDYVMSNIHRAAMVGKLADRSYTKALIDRRFPLHVGMFELAGVPPDGRDGKIAARRAELVAELNVADSDITVGRATSKIIKENPLYVRRWDRRKQAYAEPIPFDYSTIQGPLEHVVIHFYVDRDRIKQPE